MRPRDRIGPHHQRQRIAAGVVVIVFGVLALLDNLHLFDVDLVRPLWPLVFVVAGVLKLQRADHSDGGRAVGAALIVVGAAWTLRNYGFMHFPLRQWWPLLMIGAGLYVIVRGLQRGTGGDGAGDAAGGAAGGGDAPGGAAGGHGVHVAGVDLFASRRDRVDHASRLDAAAVLSGSAIRCDTQALEGGEITVALGGLEIDLRDAALRGPEARLDVFVLFGGLVLRVPPGWSVTLRGLPVLGGMEDKTVPGMGSTGRLVIDGHVIMGGLEVRN